MTAETWLLYVGTTVLWMSAPGPSHLLMLSTAMSNGFHRSLATAAGDLSANAIQIILAGTGLAAFLTASRYGFAVIKWAGVAYLVWIGARKIIASYRYGPGAVPLSKTSLRQLWLRGFVTSSANPKAIVFFAALFPQFIDPSKPLAAQIAILGATFIVTDGLFLSAYGKGASWLADRLQDRRKALVERVAGLGLVVAAVLLGLRTSEQP